MKILLAEDNEINQEVASAMLEELGHSVEVAANGRIAVEKASKSFFDIIIMDCQMPEMDGYEAAAVLKPLMKSGKIPKTPIVALTAHAMVGDREKCLNAGMDDYMTKPIEEKTLKDMVRKWCEGTAEMPGSGAFCEVSFGASMPKSTDQAAIGKLKNLMGERFGSLIKTYIENSQKIVSELIKAVKEKDMEQVAKLAHTLKSPAAQVGALDLAEKAAQLEQLAKDNQTANVAALVGSICIISDNANIELRKLAA